MDVLSALGSAGIGLVCGWLVGRPRTALGHKTRTWLALAGGCVAVGALVFRLAGALSLLVFFAALPTAALAHYAWLRRLSDRVGPPPHRNEA
jgi:hypothetical protein